MILGPFVLENKPGKSVGKGWRGLGRGWVDKVAAILGFLAGVGLLVFVPAAWIIAAIGGA